MRRALLALTMLIAAGGAAMAGAPKAFIELFTSQGCASCPPADALVGQLAHSDDILAVTMPVKLWDFLGWRDTLATDVLTKRQMAYSVARGDRDLYTPQVVVNGTAAVLGSDAAAIRTAIGREGSSLDLPIDLRLRNGILEVRVPAAPDVDAGEATLWLLVVDETVEVPIEGGENHGRHLTYHNVVRQMRPIGMWKGEPMALDLPLEDMEQTADLGCIVIAQVENFKGPGRIIGAAAISRLFPSRTVVVTPTDG